VANLFPAGSFDVVFATTSWKYVDDPVAVLPRCRLRAMRDSSAILSVIVRNQAARCEAAIQAGRLAAAEQNLPLSGTRVLCYAGKVRLFTAEACKPC